MFPLPSNGNAHWVYDDPSGVPETPAPVQVAKPKRAKIVRLPVPAAPVTPKAA